METREEGARSPGKMAAPPPSSRRRAGRVVACGPVFGLRPGEDSGCDELLLKTAGGLAWVPETTRPDLAADVWKFYMEIIQRASKSKRLESCCCPGCLSPVCGNCTAAICGGTGGKIRCTFSWCARPRTIGKQTLRGRGELLREREILVPLSMSREGEGGRAIFCLGICLDQLGGTEQRSPCPHLETSRVPIMFSCDCDVSEVGTLNEQSKIHATCGRWAAAMAVEGGRAAVWQEVRRYVASDGRKTPCVFPDCESSAAGIRGLYHHFLTDHWEALPPGTKLSVAGYLSLLIGWRTAGYTIREPAWLRVKALLPGLIDSLTVNE